MELSVVGLRDLTAFDMDKIQNPFIVFDLSVSDSVRDRKATRTSSTSIPSGKHNHIYLYKFKL